MTCHDFEQLVTNYFLPSDQIQDSPLTTKIETIPSKTDVDACCRTGAENSDATLLEACKSMTEIISTTFNWDATSQTCAHTIQREIKFFIPSDVNKDIAVFTKKDFAQKQSVGADLCC